LLPSDWCYVEPRWFNCSLYIPLSLSLHLSSPYSAL
jgi:hypothetical protein